MVPGMHERPQLFFRTQATLEPGLRLSNNMDIGHVGFNFLAG